MLCVREGLLENRLLRSDRKCPADCILRFRSSEYGRIHSLSADCLQLLSFGPRTCFQGRVRILLSRLFREVFAVESVWIHWCVRFFVLFPHLFDLASLFLSPDHRGIHAVGVSLASSSDVWPERLAVCSLGPFLFPFGISSS